MQGRVDGKDGKRSVETALRAHGIEVVISVMGGANILDQLGLIDAIQAAGTVKVNPLALTRKVAAFTAFVLCVTLYVCVCTEVPAVGVRARRGQGAAGGGRGGVLR